MFEVPEGFADDRVKGFRESDADADSPRSPAMDVRYGAKRVLKLIFGRSIGIHANNIRKRKKNGNETDGASRKGNCPRKDFVVRFRAG